MKAQVIIVGEYEIPDDLEERKRVYHTTDLDECMKIDAGGFPVDLLECCDRVAIVGIVPAPEVGLA